MANRLKLLRERLGFSIDEVAAIAELSRDDMRAIETMVDLDDLDAHLATVFEDLYGVDIERWLELQEEDLEASLPPMATLLRAQADVLGSTSRFAIAEASTVARRVRALQRAIGAETSWVDTCEAFHHDNDYSVPAVGERLADTARERLRLDAGAVPSMRRLLDDLGIVVLWEHLPSHIDALSIANDDAGGVIVANTAGPHMAHAFSRRVSFAHELCHLFYDRPRMQQLERFCVTGRAPGKGTEDLEARARAFTMYFLAPRALVEDAWKELGAQPLDRRVRRLMERFGAGYEATRHHLHYLDLLSLDDEIGRVESAPAADWEEADPPWHAYVEKVALDAGVAPLRAGALFDIVWRACREGVLGDSAARHELRIDAAAWQQLKLGYAGRRPNEWSTSSALDE